MGTATNAPGKEQTAIENGHISEEDNHDKLYEDSLEKVKKPYCSFLKIVYVVLSIITMFKCIAVIAVSVSTAIATKTFSIQQSGRLVAMIILAVTAAITLSMIIYSVLAVFRKQTKPLHASAVVLVALAIIQSIICAAAVNLTTEDEINLGRALLESFRMAREENSRHVKLWSLTQSDLSCCGLYGTEDYRTLNLPLYFPPDVPISCCPSYDPSRSELVQERERENCKARREYYEAGCRGPVLEMFRYTAALVLSVTIVFIVMEILLSLLGTIISHKQSKQKHVAVVQDIENLNTKS